jgi:hypothetical protein
MYRDRWIECTAGGIRVRGYYFPWGTKRIGYSSIRSVHRVEMGPLTGRWRVWGTANPRMWASLDPGRPRKHAGFIVDTGRFVHPLLTPDDPDAFAAEIGSHVSVTQGDEPATRRFI